MQMKSYSVTEVNLMLSAVKELREVVDESCGDYYTQLADEVIETLEGGEPSESTGG